MINPNNLYVGLATFICPDADFKNTTSGEFSFETGLDEGQAKAVKNKVQKIQVQNQGCKKAYMEPFKEKLASSKNDAGEILCKLQRLGVLSVTHTQTLF